MKPSQAKRKIGSAAKEKNKSWVFVRQGGSHELWQCGSTVVVIPRHEIKRGLLLGISRRLERELGKDWWK